MCGPAAGLRRIPCPRIPQDKCRKPCFQIGQGHRICLPLGTVLIAASRKHQNHLDYRSLYHHFECATYMYGTGCIPRIEEDCLHPIRSFESSRSLFIIYALGQNSNEYLSLTEGERPPSSKFPSASLSYLKAGFQAFILRYSVGEDAVWPNPLDDYEQQLHCQFFRFDRLRRDPAAFFHSGLEILLYPGDTACPIHISAGYVIPYGDCPLDGEKVGERVYMDTPPG